MNFSIITELPIGLVVLCPLVGFAIAYILYRRDSKFEGLSKFKLRMLMTFRFLLVTILSFLLLSPLVKTLTTTVEKPLIVFAQDNSSSIVIDSVMKNSLLQKYASDCKLLTDNLAKKYDVVSYSFGNKVEKATIFSYDEKITDFSLLFDKIKSSYVNRNVGAVIIASDGIYNQGIDPVYSSEGIDFPIYTVALGDTNTHKDLLISRIISNEIAFLGNKFPVRIHLKANELRGKSSVLSITKNGTELFSQKVNVINDNFTEVIDVELHAAKAGLQQYNVELKPVDEEVNKKNNYRTIIIDVIDSKQKVLILYNSAHPDVGALKRVLEKNPNYSVDFFQYSKFTQSISDYNVVIFHQIPSLNIPATNILKQLKESNIPALFVLGAQSNFSAINNLQLGLTIAHRKNAFDEAQSYLNEQFSLFDVGDEVGQLLKHAPPLVVPFGNFKAQTSANVLAFQTIKSIKTEKPLLLFMSIDEQKYGVISGEGIWRWRIHDYHENNNHETFDNFFNKIIQYLALQANKERFVVNTKKVFTEAEQITFEAQVYNASLEQINDAIVRIDIFDENQKKYSFTFAKSSGNSKNFYLDIESLNTGNYSFKAKAVLDNGEEFEKNGNFTVIAIDIEELNTTANHQLLFSLAKQHNGNIYFPDQLQMLESDILTNADIVSVSYTEKNLRDLINLKWLFFTLLAIVSIEWFLRKLWGSY